ncbi:MAG: polysaccharide biosynthesis protein [Rhodospirillales bacterium]|nr:polysaccharide biosynthesis protein [Rhodospirillales bacterium]
MVDRIVRMGLGVFVGIWIARYLGPEGFGNFNFAVSFVALFGTLTTFGLDGIIIREIVRDHTQAPELLGTAFALRIGASLLAPPLAIFTIWLVQPNDGVTLVLVSLLSLGLVFQAVDTIDCFFQSQVRSKLTVWPKNVAFLLMAGVRISLIHSNAPIWTFAAAQVAESALGAIGLIATYLWAGGRLSRWRLRTPRAVELVKQSWPIILSSMAIMVYMRIDMVMLKLLQGDRAAGLFAAATRVTEVWYFIPAAIVSSVAPAIMQARLNPPLYYARIQKLFNLMTLMSLAVGSCVALGSDQIIHILYSADFGGAAPVLKIHVWASIFVFLGVAQGPWNLSENLLKLGFYRTLAGAFANVLLNLILIPRYSEIGAAYSTVVSYAIASVFSNAFSPATRPIFVMQMRSLLLLDVRSPPRARG